MSTKIWPLGSEVKRQPCNDGAMLYNASRVSNFSADWFDPEFWRAQGALEGEAQGRGTVYFFRHHDKQYVLRRYRRGGLMAHLSQDRYFWRSENSTRPFAEWQLTYHLHRAGLAVPAPVAARYQRTGISYSGALITERLCDAESLAFGLRTRVLTLMGWLAIGRCIRSFHELGVCHADLNAHNILLSADGTVYLIDFDRGALRKPGMWCDSNLVRLRRSLEKVTYSLPAEHFTETDWHSLLGGYQEP